MKLFADQKSSELAKILSLSVMPPRIVHQGQFFQIETFLPICNIGVYHNGESRLGCLSLLFWSVNCFHTFLVVCIVSYE